MNNFSINQFFCLSIYLSEQPYSTTNYITTTQRNTKRKYRSNIISLVAEYKFNRSEYYHRFRSLAAPTYLSLEGSLGNVDTLEIVLELR